MQRTRPESSKRRPSSSASLRQRPSLAIIAPAAGPALQVSPSEPSSAAQAGDSRRNLPPRSRSGCWTCRNRKVKCDEVHPTCGPCERLNLKCDYESRLTWKDDTEAAGRGLRRTRSISLRDCPAWDPHLAQLPLRSPNLPQDDDLPAFTDLETDEEREKKATFQPAGTYHIVTTPQFFADLPEYSEEHVERQSDSAISETSHQLSYSGASERADPNVVVVEQLDSHLPHTNGQHIYDQLHRPLTWPLQTLSVPQYAPQYSVAYSPVAYTTMAPHFPSPQLPMPPPQFPSPFLYQSDWANFGPANLPFAAPANASYGFESSATAQGLHQSEPRTFQSTLPYVPTLASSSSGGLHRESDEWIEGLQDGNDATRDYERRGKHRDR